MTQVNGWYDAYFRAMFTLGWVQSDIHFEAYEFGSAALSIALAKLAEHSRGESATLQRSARSNRAPPRPVSGQPRPRSSTRIAARVSGPS
jgi:hypothetical protein